jgi:outer membrane protein OmpA-like peptidoglycan-associated protein
MDNLPSSTITLVGSSEKGPEDGRAMAGSIKQYLTDVFRIDASRISIEGRDKPKIPSEKPGATRELNLLREGDRRVSIESSSPALLMEFRDDLGAPLKSVRINAKQTAPLDSYVTFDAPGAKEAFSSWTVEVMDNKGEVQYFGPYKRERVSIPGKTILGTRPQADFKVTMVGQMMNGKTVKQTVPVHMVLWTPAEGSEGMRYSVLYEFDESKSIAVYDKYLTDIVTPKIPKEATVIIHGYTDIIGETDYNENLSLQRAQDVKNIISGALAKAGRADVKFEVHGFGEDETLSLFANRLPEERFYNRTVVIDIIPGK